MKSVFKYLSQSGVTNSREVDRLIVSAFFAINKIEVNHNLHLKELLIKELQAEENSRLKDFVSVIANETSTFGLEQLIELFEFVISPSDKIINGAVYTPVHIREYIVENAFNLYTGQLETIIGADIACGCGGFLLSMAAKLRERTNRSFSQIYGENIFGIDITSYSIDRTKILLTIYALMNGEDEQTFQFNLFTGNSLEFDWVANSERVEQNGGFDILVGNPPYVCSRNMDAETLALLERWEVSRTGHPDLYIPFFQIGIENLNDTGVLGYITVNTFIKSINGRGVREYFAANDINLKLLNFGGEQIFQDRNTYTCICFLTHGNGGIDYIRLESNELDGVNLENLLHFNYDDLNHHDGWNLVNEIEVLNFINVVENIGIPFKDLYNTKNGIATLKNDVYKFKPVYEDREFYYLEDGGQRFQIEVGICRDIINANKLKQENDIDRIREKIIFPYDERTVIIPENIMQVNFPQAYNYLTVKRQILSGRDKGNRDYETWYAYGRRQSMDIHAYKLFFPHICDRPTFVLCEEMDLLFYNGMAIVSNSLEDLLVIKKIMESDLFFKYISNTTKDYSSGYISMSRNYLKNFGVYQLDAEQRATLLELNDVNAFLEELYGVNNLQFI
ncbi:class I SAM-dependent DNA methyltransferase [Mucilaginibacter sp.]|jgi:methylase of polypeptide subunit release factors|uniref:HsdM family class I SAM-dependent methyltransferase n=1 Tax=Mucilaginibacter sp. TaxID=1882438 RepID=UPI00356883E6